MQYVFHTIDRLATIIEFSYVAYMQFKRFRIFLEQRENILRFTCCKVVEATYRVPLVQKMFT